MAPRQLMPGPHLSSHESSPGGIRDAPCAASTSSFGMSGVNAHMIMTPPTPDQPMHEALGAPKMQPVRSRMDAIGFRRLRFWGAPQAHVMLSQFSKSSGGAHGSVTALFQGRLDTPRLAFLWDHEVMGRGLLAGAAMLEAALAAAGSITAADEGMRSRVAVNSASIVAPYVLPGRGAAHISCNLNLQ